MCSLHDEHIIRILSQLDMKTLAFIRQSCYILHWYGLLVLDMRYDSLLRPYVSSPGDFRRLLDKHNAFIGGSTALEFFLGGIDWKPNDLDIFVRADTVVAFFNYFRGQGYNRVAPWEDNLLSARRVPCTEASLRLVKGCRSVDIIITSLDSPLDPIMHTWATVVMNALSGSRAVCSYPHETINHEALVTRPKSVALQWTSISNEQEKYESRNFRIVDHRGHPDMPASCRHVADNRCLVVYFHGLARTTMNFWGYRQRWLRDATHHTSTIMWYEHKN